MDMRIIRSVALADVDDLAIPSGWDGREKGDVVSGYLTEEISKAGGQAIVAADAERLAFDWALPAPGDGEVQQVAYVSHMLQAGILIDPSPMIANTAYAGGIPTLGASLLLINSTGRNRYVAERDARILSMAAPMSVMANTCLGLILLENGKHGEAAGAFGRSLEVDPEDYVATQYRSVALTCARPEEAVAGLEKCIGLLARAGRAPDGHLRASYGMALAAAGCKAEAGIQFMLACGSREPAMTPSQWARGGYRVSEEDVRAALLGGKADGRG